MATVAVRHRVTDFDAWKSVYDEHQAVRQGHGCTGDTVLRDVDDASSVLIVTRWPSRAAAEAFRDDPSLPEAMRRGGVVGAPRIEIYEETTA